MMSFLSLMTKLRTTKNKTPEESAAEELLLEHYHRDAFARRAMRDPDSMPIRKPKRRAGVESYQMNVKGREE
jgi:hypothetical protein